jgi:hypothetical protein
MGSIRFDGVRFVVYSMDHEPRHVHGFYTEVEVIVDLRLDGRVSLGNRTDAAKQRKQVGCASRAGRSRRAFQRTGISVGEASWLNMKSLQQMPKSTQH